MSSSNIKQSDISSIDSIDVSAEGIEELLSATITEPRGRQMYIHTIAEQFRRLQTLASFRQRLVEFMTQTLNEGVNTDFHLSLLKSAIEVIPGAQAGNLLIYDESNNDYYYAATFNYCLSEPLINQHVSIDELAIIYAEVQPSVLNDLSGYALPHIQRLAQQSVPRSIKTSMTIPVLASERNIAFLTLDNFDEVGVFNNETISMAEAFAVQTAVVLERLKLETQLRKRTTAIEEVNHRLEQANQYKSDFLASMSHELRTPLTSIIGFSELLREGTLGAVNDIQKEALQDVLDSGNHLLTLINDVLDLAKVESGRMDLMYEDFDLNEVIEESYRIIRERAERRKLATELQLWSEGAFLRGDRRKIKQVVLNLLSNAVKFTPEHGTITINVDFLPSSLSWKVSVRDTGIGISREDKRKLFQEYAQLNTNSKERGTGLGLAISKRFVELHGGYIDVRSKPNKGSTFTFTLPKFAQTPTPNFTAVSKEHMRPEKFRERPQHIVIAHSDNVVRSEINHQLNNKVNQQIIELSTGQEVITWLQQYVPDLLITGFSLKDMSGLDILERTQSTLPTLLLVANDKEIPRDITDIYPNVQVVSREMLLEGKFEHLIQRTLLIHRDL